MFREVLQEVVEKTDGGLAAILMGYDGIPVEQYVEGDGGVRRSISHQKDPLGRETWTSYGGVVEKRGYDRNDNLVAIGIPYNGTAGDFCGVGSSSPDAPTDTKCTSLGYDRADRISQVKEFYSGSNVTVRAATC